MQERDNKGRRTKERVNEERVRSRGGGGGGRGEKKEEEEERTEKGHNKI